MLTHFSPGVVKLWWWKHQQLSHTLISIMSWLLIDSPDSAFLTYPDWSFSEILRIISVKNRHISEYIHHIRVLTCLLEVVTCGDREMRLTCWRREAKRGITKTLLSKLTLVGSSLWKGEKTPPLSVVTGGRRRCVQGAALVVLEELRCRNSPSWPEIHISQINKYYSHNCPNQYWYLWDMGENKL